ncbi:MAG: HD domain-containing protein [Bacillaceae bacterium]|nr:HD domain-containing protein [Bacillaceae bacterium]
MNVSIRSGSGLKKWFFEMVSAIISENRYGFAVNRREDFLYIEKLFAEFAGRSWIKEKLLRLKNWDEYSFLHTIDVFIIGNLLARSMGIKSKDDFAIASLLFDIGKLKLPPHILKKSKLSKREMKMIRRHPLYAVQMIKGHTSLVTQEIIMDHHERLDGSGYPHGLKSEEMNMATRILSVADVYSALTLHRADRPSISGPKALEVMLRQRYAFDQTILARLMDLLHIYPVGSAVRLSNQRYARITDYRENACFIQEVRETYTGKQYTLPEDLSVTVNQFLCWKESDYQLFERERLVRCLTNHQKHSFAIFEEMGFEKSAENMYQLVVLPSAAELRKAGHSPKIVEDLFIQWIRKKAVNQLRNQKSSK